MARVHFTSAHFGGSVPWIPNICSEIHDVTFNYYDDYNFPSRRLSMHPRFKSKIPKMLEWKFIESDWYVWMDSSIKPHKGIDLASEVIKQAASNPLILFRHSKCTTIREEANRTLEMLKHKHPYFMKRYAGEPIHEQLIHYYGDPEFIDNKLFSTNFFAYHKSISQFMQDWFYEVIHWSLQCQISLPYILHKSNIKYSLFEGFTNIPNKYFEWDWKTRENNLRND